MELLAPLVPPWETEAELWGVLCPDLKMVSTGAWPSPSVHTGNCFKEGPPAPMVALSVPLFSDVSGVPRGIRGSQSK